MRQERGQARWDCFEVIWYSAFVAKFLAFTKGIPLKPRVSCHVSGRLVVKINRCNKRTCIEHAAKYTKINRLYLLDQVIVRFQIHN